MTQGVTPVEEIQKNKQEPVKGTPETKPDDVNWEARHKEAADALSSKAEENIKTNVKLATLDPKSIVDMDLKMQNKVISEIYGYNNIDELKVIQGDEFWKSSEDKDLTEHEELSQKVKILELQNKKSDIGRAIENYQKDNKKIFEDNSDALDKINAELAYISESLPANERVERAGKILYGENYVDATTAAYLSMQDKSLSAGAKANRTDGRTENTSFADFAKASGFLK